MFSKILKFSLIILCFIASLNILNLAIAYMGPTWKEGMKLDEFITPGERKIIESIWWKIGIPEVGNCVAAYVEYKISRQMTGGYHEKAIKNFDKTSELFKILTRKRSLYKGTVYGLPTRQSDFLGIKQGLFNKGRPELFHDFLEACNRAWFAK